MVKQKQRYECEVCHKDYGIKSYAIDCENKGICGLDTSPGLIIKTSPYIRKRSSEWEIEIGRNTFIILSDKKQKEHDWTYLSSIITRESIDKSRFNDLELELKEVRHNGRYLEAHLEKNTIDMLFWGESGPFFFYKIDKREFDIINQWFESSPKLKDYLKQKKIKGLHREY